MKHKYGLLLLALFLLRYNSGLAQQLVFRHFTTETGLPSQQVYKIYEDSKGYMWFATDNGVARFDGQNLKTYSIEEGLSENTIFLMCEDVKQTMWFAHFNRSLYYLEGDTVKPYVYNEIIHRYVMSPGNEILSIEFDEEGSLWLGLKQYPFVLSIVANGKVLELPPKDRSLECIYIIRLPNQRALLAGTPFGDSARFVYEDYGSGNTYSESFPPSEFGSGSYEFLLQNNDKYTFIGERLLGRFDTLGVRQSRRFDHALFAVYEDDDGGFWLGTKNNGVYYFEDGSIESTPQVFFDGITVLDIKKDREGGMWFSTLEDGVFYCPVVDNRWLNVSNGLPDNNVTSICKWNGRLVMGHSSGYLSTASPDLTDVVYEDGYEYINGVADLGNGQLLVSSVVSPKENQVIIFNLDTWQSEDTVWAVGPGGVVTYCKSTNKRVESDRFKKLVGQRIESLIKIGPEHFLIGTLDGLHEWKRGGIEPLSKVHKGFASRVVGIERISSEYFAIATRGNGVLFWNGDKVIPITTEHQLASNECNVLILDESNVPWVGTNNGLDRVIFDTVSGSLTSIQHFGRGQGLASANIMDLYMDSANVWVATDKGVNRLPRTSDLPDSIAPPIYITQTLLSGIPAKSESTVGHTNNLFEIEYSGITFKEPENLSYRYRLLGSKDEWHTTKDRRLTYPSLEPGDYTFEVVAIKSGGLESEQPAIFSFTIRAPLWKRSYFWPIIVLLLAILLILVFRNYAARIRSRELLLREVNRLRETALRNQMNPHFVYNAMNSIQSLILKDERDKASGYLTTFAGLLRSTFDNSGRELVLLHEDLSALGLYAELEQMRYPEELEINFDISKELTKALVPPLLIQPFVENAILHGVLASGSSGKIHIKIQPHSSNSLMVQVQNNGPGFNYDAATDQGKNASPSGMGITIKRIDQFNSKYKIKTQFQILDTFDGIEKTGVTVQFLLAIKHSYD